MTESIITFENHARVDINKPCPNCGGKLTIAKPGHGWADFLTCEDCGVDHGDIIYSDSREENE